MERTEAIEGLDDAALLTAARQWRPWSFRGSTPLYAGLLLPLVVAVVTLILAGPNWGTLGIFVGTESTKLTGNLAADGSQYGGWRLARLIETAVQRRGGSSTWYGATDAATGSVTIGRT